MKKTAQRHRRRYSKAKIYLHKKRSSSAIYVVLVVICKKMDDNDSANRGSNDLEYLQGLIETDNGSGL